MNIPKTYLVDGMMEWHLELETGLKRMPYITVNFTGGQITGYGVSPARFTTDNPFVQNVIENSEYFSDKKSKRIRRLIRRDDLREWRKEESEAREERGEGGEGGETGEKGGKER